jgi:hypothetical protein
VNREATRFANPASVRSSTLESPTQPHATTAASSTPQIVVRRQSKTGRTPTLYTFFAGAVLPLFFNDPPVASTAELID